MGSVDGVKRTIWAVSSGSYSDYSVVAVFATQEMAEEYARRSDRYESHHAEEFTFYDEMPTGVEIYSRSASVLFDGTVEQESLLSWTDWDEYANARDREPAKARINYRGSTRHMPRVYPRQEFAYISVTGSDKDRVEKAFTDNVAQVRMLATAEPDEELTPPTVTIAAPVGGVLVFELNVSKEFHAVHANVASGWKEYTIDPPVTCEAGVEYVARIDEETGTATLTPRDALTSEPH